MPRAGQVVAPIEESALALDRQEIAPGASARIGDPVSDTLVFVTAGKGSISLDGDVRSLAARDAALVLAGEEARIGADEALDLVVLSVGAEADRHAPLGRRALTASLDVADGQQATGARSFQILFDATNGSTRATLFAGYVPPGKAPWHYHLYDEIVWIPEGPARLHVDGAVEDVGPGSAFRLRPREVHIVENPSADRELTILGLFTPAGSPSAAYLTAEGATEYRFAD
jgi:quercetin dioxygenase-like cupin family protein